MRNCATCLCSYCSDARCTTARRQAAIATPAAIRQTNERRGPATLACVVTARMTSEVNAGDAVARGRLRIEVLSCVSFMVVSSLPPGRELPSQQVTGPGNSRLHRPDANVERHGNRLVRPFFDLEKNQRRAELERKPLQSRVDLLLDLVSDQVGVGRGRRLRRAGVKSWHEQAPPLRPSHLGNGEVGGDAEEIRREP